MTKQTQLSLTPAQVKFVQNLQATGLTYSEVYPYIQQFRTANQSLNALGREHFENVVYARTAKVKGY